MTNFEIVENIRQYGYHMKGLGDRSQIGVLILLWSSLKLKSKALRARLALTNHHMDPIGHPNALSRRYIIIALN